MIEVRLGELAETNAAAILRPVAADWSPVTPATRRLEIAAGPDVAAQCERLGELPVGSAAITPAGPLPSQFLIHVIVRAADQPVTAGIVKRALLNGLRRAGEWGVTTLALPPIGTGAGNLDAEQAADVMLSVLHDELPRFPQLGHVIIVVDHEYDRDAFSRALAREGESHGDAAGEPTGRQT